MQLLPHASLLFMTLFIICFIIVLFVVYYDECHSENNATRQATFIGIWVTYKYDVEEKAAHVNSYMHNIFNNPLKRI